MNLNGSWAIIFTHAAAPFYQTLLLAALNSTDRV
jgi:hypothetical protein